MDNQPDIIAYLQTIPIFLDLKPGQLARLASATTVVGLDVGVELITEGDPLDYFYIVLEGDMLVQIFVPSIGKIETSHLAIGYLRLVRSHANCRHGQNCATLTFVGY